MADFPGSHFPAVRWMVFQLCVNILDYLTAEQTTPNRIRYHLNRVLVRQFCEGVTCYTEWQKEKQRGKKTRLIRDKTVWDILSLFDGLQSMFIMEDCILKLSTNIWAASWENLFMPYLNHKGTDQPAQPRNLISAFVVRCLDSIIPLVAIPEISSL